MVPKMAEVDASERDGENLRERKERRNSPVATPSPSVGLRSWVPKPIAECAQHIVANMAGTPLGKPEGLRQRVANNGLP